MTRTPGRRGGPLELRLADGDDVTVAKVHVPADVTAARDGTPIEVRPERLEGFDCGGLAEDRRDFLRTHAPGDAIPGSRRMPWKARSRCCRVGPQFTCAWPWLSLQGRRAGTATQLGLEALDAPVLLVDLGSKELYLGFEATDARGVI